jgi:hypothetical protein
MHCFTTEDLLQFLYKETSPDKTEAIKAALEADWTLKEKYEAMVTASKELDTLNASPRQESIDMILQYAEKSVEELTPHA